jgi:gliding motility-associated-like protein
MKKLFCILIFPILFVSNINSQIPTWNWAVDAHDSGDEIPTDVDVDEGTGDIVVVGYWSDDLSDHYEDPFGIGAGSTDFDNTYGEEDGFVAKYDNTGVLQWAFKVGGTRSDRVNGVSIAPNGDIYITGTYSWGAGGDADFQGTTAFNINLGGVDDNPDMFIAKYNNAGVLQWAKRGYATTAADRYVGGNAVAAHANGVFVAGYYNDDSRFEGTSGDIVITDDGRFSQPVLLSYDDLGNINWAKYAELDNNAYYEQDESFSAVETDGVNVFVTGYFYGESGGGVDADFILKNQDASVIAGGTVTNANPDNNPDIVLVSFAMDGTFNYIQQIASNGIDKSYGIAVQGTSVYITGGVQNNANFPGVGAVTTTGTDAFISSHSTTDGSTNWVKMASTGNSDELGLEVTIDSYNNVLGTGYYNAAALDFTDGTISSVNGSEDGYIVAYASDGTYIYSRTIGSVQDEKAYSITSNGLDKVYVVGDFNQVIDFNADASVVTANDNGTNIYLAQIDAVCIAPIGGVASTLDANLCIGETTTINLAGERGTIQWESSPSGAGTWTAIGGEITNAITVTPAASTDYRAALTMAGCGIDYSNIIAVTVNAIPTVAPTVSDNNICLGESTDLDAVAASAAGIPVNGYLWDNAGILTASNIAAPTATPIAAAAPLTFNVTVTDNNSCQNTGSVDVTVNSLPIVNFVLPDDKVCIDEAAFVMSGGNPAGGTYTGAGVAGGIFTAVDATAGVHTLNYEYTDVNTCTSSANDDMTVSALPVVSIVGLNAVHCEQDVAPPDEVPDLFSGLPIPGAGESGVFSGLASGLTDNGDGTAAYDQANTGLGSFTVTYEFTDANGCVNSASQNTRTGTELFFNGLDAEYCEDEGNFTFQYTPGTSAFGFYSVKCYNDEAVPVEIVGPDFVDNADGTADFDPSGAGADTYTVIYQYLDDIGCINEIQQTVTVYPVPTASINGVDASYCTNDGIDAISGTPAPFGAATGVFTFPVPGLTDNGDGTADIDPTIVPVAGTPHDLTYTYTDVHGCSDVSAIEPINMRQAPTGTISGSATICEGTATDLTFTFSANSEYEVIYSDGTNNYTVDNSGAPAISFVESVSPIVNTTYTLVSIRDITVGNGCDGLTAGSATVLVTPAVDITTQPANKDVCPGDDINLSVVATGNDLTYEWEFDDGGGFVVLSDGIQPSGSVIPPGSHTATTLAINAIASGDEGDYIVTVSSSCGGPEVSTIARLSVGNTTTISGQPTDITGCDGTTQNFQVIVTGDNLTYEWRENGVALANGPQANLITEVSGSSTDAVSLIDLDNTYDGNVYTCNVSGNCGDDISNPATLNVDDPLVITVEPTNKSACPGAVVVYSVTATGTNVTYQWQDDAAGWGDIALATTPSLLLNNVTAGVEDLLNYRCIVSSPCGAQKISDEVSLTILDEITIDAQPSDETVCDGNPVQFQVIASGSGLTYQWQRNGVDLADGGQASGAVIAAGSHITNTLFYNSTDPAEAGNFRCVITGTCGSSQSNTVTLTVDEALAITVDPVDIDGCVGDDETFSVTATGTNLTYEWFNDADVSQGVTIANFTINTIAPANADGYYCKVSNACAVGGFSSDIAYLTVNDPTVLNAAFPADKSKCVGENASFEVQITTGTITSYQWEFNNGGGYVALTDGAQASGATIPAGTEISDNLVINNLQNADAGLYRCEVVGICGTVYSNVSTVTMSEPIAITSDPTDKLACENADVTFTVAATGTTPSYAWYKSSSPHTVTPLAVIGTNPILPIITAVAGDEDDYYCVVTNSCNVLGTNEAVSATANLTLYNPISILPADEPDNIIRCVGDDAVFNIIASGDNLAYQWFFDGNPLGDGALVSGAVVSGSATNSLSVSGVTIDEDGAYSVTVTGPCGAESRSADLTVNELVAINTQPVSKTKCDGTTTTFSVDVSGTITGYEWQFDALGGLGFNPVPAAAPYSNETTNTLSIDPVSAAEDGVYRCLISGSCGDIYTNSVNLTVPATTTITDQPVDVTDCQGNSISFSLIATGSNLSYEWFKNPGVLQTDADPDISGATTNSITIDNIEDADEGVYYCEVSGDCGDVTSGTPVLTVHASLTLNSNPTNKTVCPGGNTSYFVNVTGDVANYQWQFYNDLISDFEDIDNGTGQNDPPMSANIIVSGATTNTLNLDDIQNIDARTFRCVIEPVCPSELDINSSPAGLTVGTTTIINDPPADKTKCVTEDVDFAVDVSGTNVSYQWNKGGVPLADNPGVIEGTGTNTLSLYGLVVGDAGNYSCDVGGTCGNQSASATLTMNELVSINAHPSNRTICGGNNTTFIVNADNVVSYSWEFNDGSGTFNTLANDATYSGVGTPTLTITGVDAAEEGQYRCKFTGSCIGDVRNSNSATLNVPVTTSITDQPTDVTDCEGGTANFNLTAVGDALTYQWYKNPAVAQSDLDADITGSTNSSFTIDNLENADEGVYYCIVTGTCGSETSGNPSLTVHESLTLDVNPVSKTVCPGNLSGFVVNVSGDVTSYQWQYNDGTGTFANINDGINNNNPFMSATVDVSGAATNNLILDGVQALDNRIYRCQITPVCATEAVLNSNPAGLTVGTITSITSQPTAAINSCVGDAVDISVEVDGTSLGYQWYKNGNPIGGETANTLSFASVVIGDEDVYDCEISGTCGTETSNASNLTVNEYITFTTQPTNQTDCPGGTVAFSVDVAVPSSVTSYVWLKNGAALPADVDYQNGTTKTLTITNLDATDAADYTCRIVGPCETRTSNAATLTINETTVINSDPVDALNKCEGVTVNFATDVDGTNLTYQWYKGGGTIIPGETNTTLSLTNITTADDDVYYYTVSGACGNLTSNNASLTVIPTTAITMQPVDFDVVDGGSATFTITADADATPTYDWYFNGTIIPAGAPFTGEDSPVLTIDPVVDGTHDGNYHCVVTGTFCNAASSNPATLTINPTTEIVTQPAANTTVCEGDDLTLTVVATGGAHTYEWRLAGVPLVNGVQLSGAIVSGEATSSLNIVGMTTDQAGAFTCFIDGVENTNPAVVTVIESITINTHPIDKERCLGNSVTFNVNASGGILEYQWKKEGGDIVGADESSYTIAAVDASHVGVYTVVVEAEGSCTDVASNPAQLTVNSITTFVDEPSDVTMCEGISTTLTADYTGSNLQYQWYKDAAPLADVGSFTGSTEKDLVINNAIVTDDGSYYCEITGACGDESTTPVQVTVDPTTTITTQPISRTKCEGDQVQFVVAADGLDLTYEWYDTDGAVPAGAYGSGAVVAGEDSPTLTITGLTVDEASNFYCEITSGNGCGNITSNAASLTVHEVTVLNNVLADETICEGGTTTLTADVTGGDLSYTWKKDNVALVPSATISGEDTKDLDISAAELTDDGIYQCDISGFCGDVSTAPVQITINPSTAVTTQPIDRTKCEGDQVQFDVVADGLDLTYEWYLDGVAVPNAAFASGAIVVGEDSPTLIITGLTTAETGNFYCEITSPIHSCGDITSEAATLTVYEVTVLGVDPTGGLLCEGAGTTLTADVVGGELTYTWKKDNIALVEGGVYTGVDLQDLDINGITTTEEGIYQCDITGYCNDVSTTPVTITVDPATTITTQPVSRTKCEGNQVQFFVAADGLNLNYGWYFDDGDLISGALGDGAHLTASGSNVAGSGTSTLTITGLQAADAGSYYCEITSGNSCGDVTSNNATLVVYENTVIDTDVLADKTICEGATTNFAMTAIGGNLIYTWKKDGVAVPDDAIYDDVNTNELKINGATLSEEGIYTCDVSGSCGPIVTTTSRTLTIDPTTAITVQPIAEEICVGDSKQFIVEANGLDLTYLWYKDGNPLADAGPISNSDQATMTIDPLDATHTGNYYCLVTSNSGCGNVSSNTVTITVNEITVIDNLLSNISDRTECEDANTTFSINASGGSLTYQWYFNGTTTLTDIDNISGSQEKDLVITGIELDDDGVYTCEVSGFCNDITSNPGRLTVEETTTITVQPISRTKCEGDDVTFYVDADGATLSYLWYKDGVTDVTTLGIDYTGGNTNTLTISNLEVADAGSYSCEIMGNCTDKTSTPAILTIYENTVITAGEPSDVNICEESTAVFTVNATGSNLTYQWKLNGVAISDTGSYSGSTSDELTITNASLAYAGTYNCEVSGECGSGLVSELAVLTIYELPRIIVQPVSQGVNLGGNFTLSVFATGTNLSYQWLQDGNPVGGNSNTYSVVGAALADAGAYQCEVEGVTCGVTVNSEVGNIEIYEPTQIDAQTDPIDPARCVGDPITFTVSASGSNLTYQWKKDGANLSTGGTITGANSPSLNISSLSISDGGVYQCLVEGSYGDITTDASILTVNDVISFTTQPANKTKCEDDEVIFVVAATGVSNYQWQKDGVDIDGVANTSALTNTLHITNLTTADGGVYTCDVTGTCGTLTSNTATLTITSQISLSSPSNAERCTGQTATFSITATGTVSSYQWIKDGSPLVTSTRITGVNGPNLIIDDIILTDDGVYSCDVTGNCGTVTSTYATLLVNEAIEISLQPTNVVECEGEDAFFSISATGTDLSYQWYKDGIAAAGANIFGATASNLIISNITAADIGTYQCEITSAVCGVLNSNPASLNVDLLPENPGVIVGDDEMCQADQNLIFEVPAVANATEYRWVLPYGASIIDDPTSRLVEINFASDAVSGIIQVYGKNACGESSTPSSHNVTVKPLPYVYAGIDRGVCGYETSMEGNIVANGIWTKLNGSGIIDDATLNNTDVTNLSQGDNTFVWTVTDNGCVTWDTVTITNKKIIVDAGDDQRICDTKTDLDASDPGSGSGRWSVMAGSSGLFEDITDPNTLGYALQRGGNVLKWTVTIDDCPSDDTVTIYNDIPTYANAGPDQNFVGTVTNLEGNDPEVGTGVWTLVYGSGTIVDPFAFDTEVNELNPGENKFRWTTSYNECTSYDDVLITNETPTIINAGDDQIVCDNTATLEATQPILGYGEWIVASGSATFEDNTRHDTRVTELGFGDNILVWSVTEVSITTDTVVITNSLPTQANAGPDRNICADSALLQGNIINTGDGYWSLIGGAGQFEDSSKYNTKVRLLGLGSNTLRWTSKNGNCTTTDEVVISNDNPTVAYAGEDQVLCTDSAILYNNEPSIGTGEWSIYSGAGTFNFSVVNNLASGDNILLWTITNGQCKSADTVLITNNLPTEANAGGDMIICVDSVVLSANFPFIGTGVWSVISGSAELQDSSINNTKVNDLSLGTNVLRWTIENNGCTTADEIIISYDLVIANAGNDQIICSNATALSASNPSPGTGEWSIVGGSGAAQFLASNEPNTSVEGLEQGDNVLRWTITNSGCVSYDDLMVTNNTPTTAIAGADQNICIDQTSVTANDPTHGTGEWTVIGGAATIANPTSYATNITELAYGSNTLRWTITKEGCTAMDEVVVKNNKPSDASAGDDQTICADSTVMMANTPVYGTGEWTIIEGTGSFQLNNFSNSNITGLAYGTNTFVWTITKVGCESSDTVQITNDLPATPDAGPDQVLCSSSVQMAANSPGNLGLGEWIMINGAATIPEDEKNVPYAIITDLGLGANTLRWKITKNACSLSDDVTIYNNMPSTSDAGEDQDICGDSTFLQANLPTVGEGSWTLTGGYAEIVDPTSHNTKIRNLGYDDNYLKWTVTNGQCVSVDVVKVTNNLSYVYAGDDTEVYEPQTNLVANNPGDNADGLWLVNSGNGVFENDTSFETQVTELGSGANTFSWTITKNGCVVSDDVVITYYVLPIPQFGISETSGCPPFTIELVNESIGGDRFEWDFDDGNDTASAGTFTHTYINPGSYNVQLTAYGYADIPVVLDTLVTVYSKPVANFDFAPDTIYIPGQFLSCINESEGGSAYLWDFDDGTTDTTKNPAHVYEEEGDYHVLLQVLTSSQCADSIWKNVHVEELAVVTFPTGFTPGQGGGSEGYYDPNDLSNDIFFPEISGEITNYSFEIYNRWGVLMFETNEQNRGWDGYYQGEMLKEGAYVWKVSGILNNGKPFVKAGTVILIRNP